VPNKTSCEDVYVHNAQHMWQSYYNWDWKSQFITTRQTCTQIIRYVCYTFADKLQTYSYQQLDVLICICFTFVLLSTPSPTSPLSSLYLLRLSN